MAKTAYIDQERTKLITAEQAANRSLNDEYYCKDKKCNALLHICSMNGLKDPYFAPKYDVFPHIDGCNEAASAFKRLDKTLYIEDKDDFEHALDNLQIKSKSYAHKGTHGTGESNKKYIRTILQIYSLCKSYVPSTVFAGKQLGLVLVDDRSIHIYTKGVFGPRLIEGNIDESNAFNVAQSTISLIAPINSKKYRFLLKFTDKQHFNNAMQRLITIETQ